MSPTAGLAVVTERLGQRATLRVQGELDVTNRDVLHGAISSALENRPPLLVVDLSGLDFIDCAALSVLVRAHGLLAGRGHRLVVTRPKPAVQRLLNLLGLDAYLQLNDTDADISR